MNILVTGANGQLGNEMRALSAENQQHTYFFTDVQELDICDEQAIRTFVAGNRVDVIVNCAAYTAVDKAEDNPELCDKLNHVAPGYLAAAAEACGAAMIQVSTDYVFDGTADLHSEDEAFAPLGVYGQTKAAGDIAVANAPEHYILRSSWVIGEGRNFVKTMMMLSDRVANPDDQLEQVTVVDDQYGRLTFTKDMAEAIFHLLDSHAPYGTYNLTGSGAVRNWAQIASRVFELTNGNGEKVKPISTAEYFANAKAPVSPRPEHSALDLSKIKAAGYTPADWEETLEAYVNKELGK